LFVIQYFNINLM